MVESQQIPVMFNKKVKPESNIIEQLIPLQKEEPPIVYTNYQESVIIKKKPVSTNFSNSKNKSEILTEELPLSSIFKNPERLTPKVQVFRNPESKNKRIVLNSRSNLKSVSKITGNNRTFWGINSEIPIKKMPIYSQTRPPIIKTNFVNRQHSVSANIHYSELKNIQNNSIPKFSEKRFTNFKKNVSQNNTMEIISTNYTPIESEVSWSHNLPTKRVIHSVRKGSLNKTPNKNTHIKYSAIQSRSNQINNFIPRIISDNQKSISSNNEYISREIEPKSESSTYYQNSLPWTETSNSFQPLSSKQFGTEPTNKSCLLYTSPSPRDLSTSRMPSSA